MSTSNYLDSVSVGQAIKLELKQVEDFEECYVATKNLHNAFCLYLYERNGILEKEKII